MSGDPFPAWLRSAMSTPCSTCAEVAAGRNKREADSMLGVFQILHRRRQLDRLGRTLGILGRCSVCNSHVCMSHWRIEYPAGRPAQRLCLECHALRYRIFGTDGRTELGPTNPGGAMPFRRRWRLFRWRVTKNRLMLRLRISRVVVGQLPKDLAEIVATYAVK